MNRVYRDIAGPVLAPRGSVVCIGAFDGVHLGHRAVLARVRECAQAAKLAAVAVSFEPLPREFFAHARKVPRLSSAREKIAQLSAAQIGRVLLLRFNAALAAMPAAEFVERVLVARLNARQVWVGEGFRFGHARGGDFALLERMGREYGFVANALAPVVVEGERVSSSAIREALAGGSFALAARWLGRPFTIGGHVVRGAQLGRKLGYPTANLRWAAHIAGQGISQCGFGRRHLPMPGVASPAYARRSTAPSRCSKRIYSISTAICTVKGYKWNLCKSCVTRRSSPTSTRW